MKTASEPVKKITVLSLSPPTQPVNPEVRRKLRVAAYCRVSSSSDEQLSSYQAQLRNYDHYIRSRPDFSLIGIFADEGISGTDLKKRAAFNEMMQKAREGQIDLIITKSISRFGRNTLDCLKCIRELKQLNVDVYFEKENVHSNNKDGEILLTLISAVAQNESMNQSENVKWGIRRKYERKSVRSVPSGKFLGYRKDQQGNLIINEEQAETVRRIYQAFLHGLGTYQIATMLTKENVPMAYGGKEWCASHILKVLMNEKYQGDTRFQKTFNTDYLTKHRAKNRGQLPQPYLKDSHPAIIDRKTWSLIQLELERQKRFVDCHSIDKFHHHSEEYPLSGKIFCQICGQPFALRQSFRTRNYGQKYWVCRGYRAGRYGPVGPDCCSNGHRVPRDDNHNATSEDTSNYRYVSKGDFVINKMKAWQGSVAVSDYDGIVSPAYYVYKFTDDCFSKRYFHYLMRNKAYAEEFRSLSAGIRIGQWDLAKSALESIPVLIPPKKEQTAIASYLDYQCGQIDSIIEEAKASIVEYKGWFGCPKPVFMRQPINRFACSPGDFQS